MSSQDLGEYAERALRLCGSNHRMAFIKNAQDGKQADERNLNTPVKREMFLRAGFTDFEEIDLRDYFGRKDKLKKKLEPFGSVWCAGGNVYILRRAMKASGFDDIIRERLGDDTVLYGGWSAGAMVMAPDLKGPLWSEEGEPSTVPEGYEGKIIWDGLNLIDFYIVPHYGNEIHGQGPQKYAEYYESKGLDHYILEDGQAVVVDGDKTELLK